METFIFKVQGSAAEPYTVTFGRDGTDISAHCSCPAGAFGGYCKHRLKILGAITEGIVSGNEGDVQNVASWIMSTEFEQLLGQYRDAEANLEKYKKQVNSLKKKIAASGIFNHPKQ